MDRCRIFVAEGGKGDEIPPQTRNGRDARGTEIAECVRIIFAPLQQPSHLPYLPWAIYTSGDWRMLSRSPVKRICGFNGS